MNELEFCKRVLAASPRVENGPRLTVAMVAICLELHTSIQRKDWGAVREALSLMSGNMSRAVDTLVSLNLLQKTRNVNDGRKCWIELTDEGTQFCLRIRANALAR